MKPAVPSPLHKLLTSMKVSAILLLVAAADAWFQQCPSCHIFGSDMAGCNLTEWETSLPDCLPDDLVALYFRTYRPTTLPDNFFSNHIQIQSLAIQDVPSLTLGPMLFVYLPALEKLEFGNAHLQFIEPGQLFPLPELRILVFNNASLHQLPENLLLRNGKLWFFDASDNQLTGLPENLFQRNPLLTEVYLSRNRLFSVPAGLFRHNPQLKKVFLNKNRLLTLPAGFFSNNPAMELTKLAANPWKCDCGLVGTVEDISRRVNVTGPSPKCRKPLSLRGIPLSKVGEKLKCSQELKGDPVR